MTGHDEHDDVEQGDTGPSGTDDGDIQQRQYSLRRLIGLMTACAMAFGLLSYLGSYSPYRIRGGFNWLALPAHLFDGIDGLFAACLFALAGSVALFIAMVVQLARHRPRPWGMIVFLACVVVVFVTDPIYSDMQLRQHVLLLFAGSFICLFEVMFRRLWPQHWATVALSFAATLRLWTLMIFGAVTASV